MADDPRTATTLAYVSASKRVSSRLSNLFHHIYPDMLGVWLMGSDRSDLERQQFVLAQGAGAVAARLSAVAIEGPNPIEVERLNVWSDVAAQANIFTDDTDGTATWGSIIPPVFNLANLPPVLGGANPLALISVAYGGALGGAQFRVPLAANVQVTVLEGFLLPPSRRLVVQLTALNTTLQVNALVRSRDA